MKNDLWRWVGLLLTAWAGMGCQGGGNSLGAGGKTGGPFNTGGSFFSTGGIPGSGGTPGTGGTPFVDGGPSTTNWDGYAEAYGFAPDGSDRLRLTITSDGHGALEVGSSAPLAPPHDPGVGYPPSADPPDGSGLWEGFLYPIHAAQVSPDRIQLGINPNDIFGAWCALQTSYPLWQYQGTPDGAVQTAYGCVAHGLQFETGPSGRSDAGPDAGAGCLLTDPDGGASTLIDCSKLNLCVQANVCLCTATNCVSRSAPAGTPPLNYPVDLDATVDATGTSLTGTLVFGGTRVVIHLQRQ